MLTDISILHTIGVGVLLVLLYGAFLSLRRHGKRTNQAFHALARDRGGQAETPLLRFPTASLPLDGASALVKGAYASQYSSNYVEVEVKAAHPWPGRLTAHAHGYYTGVLSLFGGRRIRTHDPAFDRRFVLLSPDPAVADAVMDAEGRAALLDAAAAGRPGEVLLVVHPTSLKLRRHNVPPYAKTLGRLVDAAGVIYGKAEALRTGKLEIEIVADPGVEEAGACPVCGAPLDGKVVWCRRCHTPHHKECWRFNRGCASFACGEKRYDRKPPAVR